MESQKYNRIKISGYRTREQQRAEDDEQDQNAQQFQKEFKEQKLNPNKKKSSSKKTKRKQKRNDELKSKYAYEIKQEYDDLPARDKEFIMKYGTRVKLEYEDWPLLMWFIGITLTVVSIVMFYHIIFKSTIQGGFMEYVVFLFIIGLGFAFLRNGKIERITFNKRNQKVLIEKINIMCNRKFNVRNMKGIKDVVMRKRGIENGYNNTIHYIIQVQFKTGPHLDILESKSQQRTRQKLTDIKIFLSTQVNPDKLEIDDEGFDFTAI